MIRNVYLVAAIAAAMVGAPLRAQDDLNVILASAAVYVQGFEREFGSVVAEERYEQEVRAANIPIGSVRRGGGPTSTVLVSDFLLVQVPGQGWLGFRDVFERDGRPVRDRQERLSELFLNGTTRSALDQVSRIMGESARYNIGDVNRNINVPTLALQFVSAAMRPYFVFTEGKREEGDDSRVLDYNETGRPTFIKTSNNRDLPVRGRFWIDPVTGTIRKTEMHAIDTTVEGHVTVTFQRDEGIGMWAPAKMEERYRRPRDANEVRGVATYSKFRRFRVSTSDELAK